MSRAASLLMDGGAAPSPDEDERLWSIMRFSWSASCVNLFCSCFLASARVIICLDND